MSSSFTLIVEVVSANNVGGGLESVNPCVELRFDGQHSITSVKKRTPNPKWNERFCFSVLNRDRLSSLSLEAYVYNVDELANSKSFLGKVRLSGTSFANSNDETITGHPLNSGTITILGGSRAVLLLKVFLKNEHEQHEQTDGALELLSAANSFTFKRMSTGPNQPKADDRLMLLEINPTFESGRLVERMPYLFVRVIKARDLPDLDATGSLDPFVEVRAGRYKAVTKYLTKDQNPEWNETFAFCMDHIQRCRIYIRVKDKDKVRDDFVGMLSFDQSDPAILERHPADPPVQPIWHKLCDQDGETTEGELMTAVWIGSAADEAYPSAWYSGSFNLDASVLPHIRPKVYDSPALWYVRVGVVDFHDMTMPNDDDSSNKMYVSVSVADQLLKTKLVDKQRDNYYTWNEDLLFIAAEPFESDIRIYVKQRIGSDQDNIIGQTTIALAALERRVGYQRVDIDEFDLQRPLGADANNKDELSLPLGIIRLRNCLEGGYKVLHDPIDDTMPATNQRKHPPVGSLDLGILKAQILDTTKNRDGRPTSDAYCVAKYGGKWVRTRTVINTVNPVFNEQHTWDVFDTATFLTVGVFENGRIQEAGSPSIDKKDGMIGKVNIRLSCLQPGIIYAHAYPLLLLQPSGVKKMGRVLLAVRLSLTSSLNVISMYARPILPEMHYKSPIAVVPGGNLRTDAVRILAAKMGQTEPPLRTEVVEHMCAKSQATFGLRKSKSAFFRLMQTISGVIAFFGWLAHVRSWSSPTTTLLVHAVVSLALWFHQLILPCLLLYIFFIASSNYRFRPRYPPHINTRISYIDVGHPDELHEEFDTFPTCCGDPAVLKMRYDRLRSIAGRITEITSGLAAELEKVQALLSWRDPTATFIVWFSAPVAATVLYYVPYKILVAAAWFYIMRPPMFRRMRTPCFIGNFFSRLPDKRDALL